MSDDDVPSTPKSAYGLKQSADDLLEVEMPDAFRQQLAPVLKGAVALVSAGDLTTRYLVDRTEAQAVRNKRQMGSRRALPPGGVVTVEQARQKLARAKKEEEKNAKAKAKREATKKEKEEKKKADKETKENAKQERERKKKVRDEASTQGKKTRGKGKTSSKKSE